MNMQENARLILGLWAKGWTDTEIVDFLLWIESGDEQYKPKGCDQDCPFRRENPPGEMGGIGLTFVGGSGYNSW